MGLPATSLVGPVVKTLRANAGGMGLIPGRGTKISHATQRSQKFKKKKFLGLL